MAKKPPDEKVVLVDHPKGHQLAHKLFPVADASSVSFILRFSLQNASITNRKSSEDVLTVNNCSSGGHLAISYRRNSRRNYIYSSTGLLRIRRETEPTGTSMCRGDP